MHLHNSITWINKIFISSIRPLSCSYWKKKGAVKLSYFRPISLIHSFAKLVSKVLANRLSLELPNLISMNQNAFIKKRCIHDNFKYVYQVIRDLQRRKIPTLFIKLDISKAFDTVSWAYLLGIMVYLGFPLCWRNWKVQHHHPSCATVKQGKKSDVLPCFFS